MNIAVPEPTKSELARAVDAARGTADAATLEDLIATVRAADALSAAAVSMLGSLRRDGGVERTAGMPAEFVLRLDARATGWDATALTGTADAMAHMPATAAALADGEISFSQARSIAREVRDLDASGKARVDALVGRLASRLAHAEPEALLRRVEDEVGGLRPDRVRRREERAIEGSFLALQAHLGGGGSIYGEAATEEFATLCEAVETRAERPVDPDRDDDVPTRGRQRMEALVGICEDALAGGPSPGRTRPRPRLLATVQLADLVAMGASEGARVLARVTGRPMRLSPVATGILGCDPEVVAVLFDGATPIAVSDATKAVPEKVRTAVIARDGGCRFPGCAAPAAWSDVHHVIGREDPRSTHDPTNLVLLCRRCHGRVHRRRWRLRALTDGTIEFRYRGQTYTSVPRARPLRE